jgi:replication-associated recombination protein RarA
LVQEGETKPDRLSATASQADLAHSSVMRIAEPDTHDDPHPRDGHNSGAAALGNAQGYRYSHDDPDGVVAQQYPRDEVVGVDYYRPTGRGGERDIAGRLDRLRAIIRKKGRP